MSGSKEERFVPIPTPTTQNGGFFSKSIMKKKHSLWSIFCSFSCCSSEFDEIGRQTISDTDEEMRAESDEVSRLLTGRIKL